MIDGYWEVDGIENAIDYLEMVSHFLTQVDSDWKWKWVIISTHQALYNFGLCALAGTSGWHTVTDRGKEDKERNENQMIAQARALLIEGDTPEQVAEKLDVDEDKALWLLKRQPRILDIHQVLKRLGKKQYLPWSNSAPLQLKQHEREAIKGLVGSFRNEFEHFYPNKHWLIETKFVATMISHCIPVIEFIATESNCITYNRGEAERVKAAIKQVKEILHQYSAKNT
jgi:hypothetical protein